MAHVKICPSSIPAAEMRVLSDAIIEACKRFYADPENQRKFEMWKKEENHAGIESHSRAARNPGGTQ